MADIIIRGMEMPKGCRSCPFYAYDGDMDYYCLISSDNEPCPLLPLPEGHGRMIDADLMVEGLMKCAKNPPDDDQESRWFYLFASEIAKSCPTIVPAEGGNADA